MTTTILLSVLTGGVGGFHLGRIWAENVRASRVMKRIWNARHDDRQRYEHMF